MKKITALVLISSSLVLTPLTSKAADSDGCFKPANSCISASADWKGNRFVVKYYNNCSQRIYIRFCNELRNRKPDCGASGITPGQTKSWWSTEKNATGRYSYNFVGSTIGSADWVCSSKVKGWKRTPF